MKIGVADYGMNVWDGGLYDIELRLTELKSIGYDGTERLVASDPATALQRAAAYHRLGMGFTTCLGPDVQTSIQWSAGFGNSYVWLNVGNIGRGAMPLAEFCRRANRQSEACRRWGIQAALHNHLGQVVENQDELETFLAACPDCALVLDTGHLAAAGGDPVRIIRAHAARLCTVHVKEWLGKEGSDAATPWYQRGRFVELGAGNIGQDHGAVVAALKEVRYAGWIHVEHDTHLRDPLQDLAISRQFLREQGI